jgi:hypothetical protein
VITLSEIVRQWLIENDIPFGTVYTTPFNLDSSIRFYGDGWLLKPCGALHITSRANGKAVRLDISDPTVFDKLKATIVKMEDEFVSWEANGRV